jgi:hypothetical protein
MNGIEHEIHVLHHCGIAEAKNAKALAHEKTCASHIVSDRIIRRVLPTIDFDNELCAVTAEIRHIGADGDLATKMRFRDGKAVPQMPPQALLRFGKRSPQRFRVHGRASRDRL